ncbi:hypothetical protein [Sphingomonas sp. PB4P5]|uniref:hypothetical protein n=1 Tax=Parasphingomonas puruogangriensis TaxID=3096155 RepID=UPI002FC8964A
MYPDTAVEAPGLGTLVPRPAILGRKFVRARFSGIRASLFDEMKEIVGLASDGLLSDGARQQRRAALRDAFKRFPIPIVDLFWAGDDPVARNRRERTMRLHHWFQLEVTPGEAEGAREPIFMGEPDAGRPAEPGFESGQLFGLRALSPQEEEPLRDIFSLAHVPDADFDEGPEGSSGAPPPDDSDGPEDASVAVVWSEEREANEEELAEPERDRLRATYSGRTSTNRDDRQYVKISR